MIGEPDHRLVIDRDGLRAAARAMRACADEMDSQERGLSTMNVGLKQTWRGQASDAYAMSFAWWSKSLRGKSEATRVIADGFEKMADRFSAASEEVSSLWSGGAVP